MRDGDRQRETGRYREREIGRLGEGWRQRLGHRDRDKDTEKDAEIVRERNKGTEKETEPQQASEMFLRPRDHQEGPRGQKPEPPGQTDRHTVSLGQPRAS